MGRPTRFASSSSHIPLSHASLVDCWLGQSLHLTPRECIVETLAFILALRFFIKNLYNYINPRKHNIPFLYFVIFLLIVLVVRPLDRRRDLLQRRPRVQIRDFGIKLPIQK